jgi:hypothetical protein
MKKIVVGDYELQTEGLIMGAVIATGVGLMGLSVKNLLDARKLKYAAQQPIDDDLEFEEYKEMKVRKLKKKRDAKLRRGIIGVSVGAFATAVGVAAFTPLRRIVVNDDFTLRADRAEKLDGVVSSVRELSGAIQDGFQSKAQVIRNIDFDEIKSNIPDIKDGISNIKGNIPDIKDGISNIKENIPDINEIKSNISGIKCTRCGKCCKCGKCFKCGLPKFVALKEKASYMGDFKENIQNITALIAKVHGIKVVSEKLEARLQDILSKVS